MDIFQIKEKLKSNEYDFIRKNEHLGKNIILLTIGGSHAYGTNTYGSDLDIRGCFSNTTKEILTNNIYEQYDDQETDTVIYSLDKLINLLTDCNPNVIEILGLKPEHYLFVDDIGKQILDNSKLFLSKKAYFRFGKYAESMIDLFKRTASMADEATREQHLLETLYKVMNKLIVNDNDKVVLYMGTNNDNKRSVYMDLKLQHAEIKDYKNVLGSANSTIKNFDKLGSRNSKAIEHNKLGKHMMHLTRLILTCIDILTEERVITYREKEHDFLMDIRNEKYLKGIEPIPEFFELIDDLNKQLDYAYKNTSLPENPDYNAINEFKYELNKSIVANQII